MPRIAAASMLVFGLAALSAAQPAPNRKFTYSRPDGATAGDRNVPLLKVHQYLLRAHAAIEEQDNRSAVFALKEAQNVLGDFERQEHGPLAEKAGFMRQDIQSYIPRIGRDATLDPLDNWIRQIEHWKGNSKAPLQPPAPW